MYGDIYGYGHGGRVQGDVNSLGNSVIETKDPKDFDEEMSLNCFKSFRYVNFQSNITTISVSMKYVRSLKS